MGVRITILLIFIALHSFSQGVVRRTYHDREKRNVKEIYHVTDTFRNILNGRYVSYFLNGHLESKGQFTNNETSGIWEFFFESGNLKMRGILFKGANYGLWEYFFESGAKSMEGIINGRNRQGEWKFYYEGGGVREVGNYHENRRTGLWSRYQESGVLLEEMEYADDQAYCTEYLPDGRISGKGHRSGARQHGQWEYFDGDGHRIQSGEYVNGKKEGEWITYFPNGKVQSRGKYINDVPTGTWEYYYESGELKTRGDYLAGNPVGIWKALNEKGKVLTTVSYSNNTGDYKEFYPDGRVRCQGKLLNGKRQGLWVFFDAQGKREGQCQYIDDVGVFEGYHDDGSLKTRGTMEGSRKSGTWEIYDQKGALSGYYKPFYNDRRTQTGTATPATGGSTLQKSQVSGRRMTYFDARAGEFRGLILAGNPFLPVVGRIPASIEFYHQERLGHEFEFIGIRDPFFQSANRVPLGKIYSRGYSVAIRQKLYNPVKAGMWYLGHEFRFTNKGDFINLQLPGSSAVFSILASEQLVAWGPLAGYRIMRRNNISGFTLDVFASANLGYRSFVVDKDYLTYFESLPRAKFATTFHLGLNLGNVFSYR